MSRYLLEFESANVFNVNMLQLLSQIMKSGTTSRSTKVRGRAIGQIESTHFVLEYDRHSSSIYYHKKFE